MDSTRQHFPLNERQDAKVLLRDRPQESQLDGVYARYSQCNPFKPNGFIEHATMGPEAMIALGLGEHVEHWVSLQRARPEVLQRTGEPVTPHWQEALGDQARHGDWLDMFEALAESQPHSTIIATWVPRLLPDISAALFHGLIRTAHASRALDHRNSLARRLELARGLALWASRVDRQRVGSRRVDPAEQCDASAVLGHARVGAEAFLHAPNVPVLHFVTGPMAYLMLSQHLDNAAHAVANAAFSHTHSALLPNFIKLPVHTFDGDTFDEKHLAPLAQVPDAHPVKLTEACMRAFTATQDAVFLDAAAKVQPRETQRGGHAAH